MRRVVESRLRKAQEYLKEADILYTEKIGNLPVLANLYHAMMNCLFALLEVESIGNLTHAEIIGRFEKEYMISGIFNVKFSEALNFAYKITHECDCDHMKPPEDSDIDKLFPLVREFVQTVTTYLRK